jgi:hypothetical protein
MGSAGWRISMASTLLSTLACGCSSTSDEQANAEPTQVREARKACENSQNLGQCLVEQANLTTPANMAICWAAAAATPCLQDDGGAADLCAGAATDAQGSCKIVFD